MIGQRIRQALRRDQIEGRYDRVVLGVTVALASIGVVMVASASIAVAEGLGVGPMHYLGRHLVFLLVGVLLALAMTRMELRFVERWSQAALLLCFVLLLAVFLPGIGRTVNGAQRWLNLGISGFQAVEAVKLLLIVWLASYLVRHREQVQNRWWGLVKPMSIAAGLVALLLVQPDFGSALLLCAIVGGMVWLGGVRMRYLATVGVLALPILAVVAISESYRIRRLTSFLDPWADPFNDGFQLTQALIAIGRGEWFGVGLGASVQKLFYLPEAHTDFILAVLAEEFGFVGVLTVVALFAVLGGRALWLGLRAAEMGRAFAGYCAFGVGLWLALQSLVSIGVNLGMLPTKGLTLPLISSGGSSVLMTCAAVGLLLRVSYEIDRAGKQAARARGGDDELDPVDDADAVLAPRVPASALRGRRRIEPGLGKVA